MNDEKIPPRTGETADQDHDHDHEDGAMGVSRRAFLGAGAAGFGVAAAGLGFAAAGTPRSAEAAKGPPITGRGHRTLLKGGIVLSLDPAVGDFEVADVLIEGNKIVAVGPNLKAAAQVVDCSGKIVMPGFIATHHHRYETVQRSIISDGYIPFPNQPEQQPPVWPYESYFTVVQGIWTAGRLGSAANPDWDLGRPPQDPEDCYLSELVAALAGITQGITCGTDTSQASHTPAHTDAMVQGLMDSGARGLYDYSGGTNRGPATGYEHPGLRDNETVGVGRLRREFFSSEDQLVTLGLNAGPTPVVDPKTGDVQPYSGWELAKSFGCWINNHNVGNTSTVIDNQALLADPEIGPKLTLVHCVRWQDDPVAQIGTNNVTSEAWQVFADNGGHVSIAPIIEQQMRHGMPPFQLALNYGILPSLSPDVDTNMTPDPFSMMRGAFCIQRALANDLAYDLSDPQQLIPPQTLTCRQVIEMMTIGGAAGSGLLHKVGTLTPGKEADIVILETRSLDIAPMNNVPGSIVTMMDTSHVQHVMIAGKFKYWNYKLKGWNVDKLVRDIENSRDRMLARIQGPALVGTLTQGLNSETPYRPNFLGSCCYNGQNEVAPHYNLRP
ncbi:MAG: amidohydrolase family protein [Gammaproteobacteria bacterium]|nr:amidohydrolase family protein [Gammaproteobacteria bacterium]